MAMQLIETKTLASSTALIEFTSIPQDGTDLMIRFSGRGAAGGNADGIFVRFNSNTSNYLSQRLYGFNSSVASDQNVGQFIVNSSGSTANTFSNVYIYIPNYAGSIHKTANFEGVTETNTSNVFISIGALLWQNTSAITSLSIGTESGSNLLTGSIASLYKITKGSSGGVVVS
jgi:hypothetical protein